MNAHVFLELMSSLFLLGAVYHGIIFLLAAVALVRDWSNPTLHPELEGKGFDLFVCIFFLILHHYTPLLAS